MAESLLPVPPPRPKRVRRRAGLLPLRHRLPGPVCYVLAGGGAHGSVQWGLLQALAETDVTPDSLIGTSAGALTGAIVAEDPIASVHRLAYVWSQLDLQTLLGDGVISLMRSATKGRQALADNSRERLALECILTARSFAELDLPFAAVTTDLAQGVAVAHDTGDLIAALLASSAIPGVFPPVTINGRKYIDGLVSANLPADLAVRRGAGTVVVLDTGSRTIADLSPAPTKVIPRLNLMLASAQRRAQLAAAARHVPVVVLPTPTNLGGALDFRGTVEAAGTSYGMARRFLADLVRATRGSLKPGLYMRPDPETVDPEILAVLKVVRS